MYNSLSGTRTLMTTEDNIDKGTSYRSISLLSIIATTLEKSRLPYITADIPNTPTQHSTVTALHTVNNTVAMGFNQMASPARTITVVLDMSKVFDTITYTHLSESCYRAIYQAQSLSSLQTTSKDAKPTQHIEITHPHKVASFHQHYSTFTGNTTSITPLTQTYNMLQHSNAKKPLSLTTADTQQHSHNYYNRYKNKHAPYTYIYCLKASSHKRQ